MYEAPIWCPMPIRKTGTNEAKIVRLSVINGVTDLPRAVTPCQHLIKHSLPCFKNMPVIYHRLQYSTFISAAIMLQRDVMGVTLYHGCSYLSIPDDMRKALLLTLTTRKKNS
jgi:hypothetical protein